MLDGEEKVKNLERGGVPLPRGKVVGERVPRQINTTCVTTVGKHHPQPACRAFLDPFPKRQLKRRVHSSEGAQQPKQ